MNRVTFIHVADAFVQSNMRSASSIKSQTLSRPVRAKPRYESTDEDISEWDVDKYISLIV